MILASGDERRERYLKNGNVLWRIRNTGGGPKGCIAGGVVFLIFSVFLAGMFVVLDLLAGALVFGVILAIPGILMVLIGMLLQGRRKRKYIAYYQKLTGFDADEVRRVDRELMEPEMVMFGNVPEINNVGASEKKPQIACMITRNYFVMPMLAGKCYVRRISDMILATWSEEIPGIGGCKRGLVFLSDRDDSAYMNAFLTVFTSGEIIDELEKRNPGLVTKQKFTYGGRDYDVIKDGGEIVRLYESKKGGEVNFKDLLTF